MAISSDLQIIVTEIKQGNYQVARQMLRPLIEEAPSAEVLYLASRAAANRIQAVKFLRQAVKLNPDYKPALRDLERIRAAIEEEQVTGQPTSIPGIHAAWTNGSAANGITFSNGAEKPKNGSAPVRPAQETYAPPVLAFLPGLSSTIQNMRYKASNEISNWSLITLLAVGTLAAAGIGLLAYAVSSMLMPPLLEELVRAFDGALTGRRAGRAVLALLFILVAIGIAIAAALGYGISWGLWGIVRYARARSPMWVGIVAFLSAAIGYGIFAFVEYETYGYLGVTSGVTRLFDPVDWWFPLLIVIDMVLFIGIATYFSYKRIAKTPYDEKYHRWYTAPFRTLNFSAEAAPALLDSLWHNSIEWLAGYRPLKARGDRYPCIQLQLQAPPIKGEPFNLRVKAFWQETVLTKYGTEQQEKSKAWFQAMIPYELGRALKEHYKWQ